MIKYETIVYEQEDFDVLDKMSECEAVYFCKEWENTRGCKIEHSTAFAYGMDIIYEE